jgi:hypothetical protein
MLTNKNKWLFSIAITIVLAFIFILNMGESVNLPTQFKSYPKRMSQLFFEDRGTIDLDVYIVYGDSGFNGQQFCADNKEGLIPKSPQEQGGFYEFNNKDDFKKSILKVGGAINENTFSNTICDYFVIETSTKLRYEIYVFKNGLFLGITKDATIGIWSQ